MSTTPQQPLALPLRPGPLQSWRCDARAILIIRERLLPLSPGDYTLLLCILKYAEQETYAPTEELLQLLPAGKRSPRAARSTLYRHLSVLRHILQECDLALLCIRGYGYQIFGASPEKEARHVRQEKPLLSGIRVMEERR